VSLIAMALSWRRPRIWDSAKK